MKIGATSTRVISLERDDSTMDSAWIIFLRNAIELLLVRNHSSELIML